MKVFIVNLKKAQEKRALMTEQLIKAGVDNYEFIEAVDGNTLSLEYIYENVYDYPACSLTQGEIGCALSHLNIYKVMVRERISSAIILEDDIVIPDSFTAFMGTLQKSLDTPESKVISLGRANKLTLRRRYSSFVDTSTEYGEYTAVTAFGTYAYAINIAAANSLTKKLLPIKYEADMFIHFRENGWLNTFNVIYPQYIRVVENHEEQSDIYPERKKLKLLRHQYKKNKLLKNRGFLIRFKNRFKRILWKFRQVRSE